jgi:GNAT superfamily N-acetyltransferase
MSESTRQTLEIRPFSDDDRQAVVALLARAFDAGPALRRFIPVRKGRPDKLSTYFDVLLTREVLPNGEVQVAQRDGKIVGATFWRRPGAWQTPKARQLLDLPFWLSVFGRDLARVAAGGQAITSAHPKTLHWYLAAIGVDPPAQGTGVGSALLKTMLVRCDAERMPAYLETSYPENVPFYERRGFRVRGEQRLPDGPPVWLMWRDPQPVA